MHGCVCVLLCRPKYSLFDAMKSSWTRLPTALRASKCYLKGTKEKQTSTVAALVDWDSELADAAVDGLMLQAFASTQITHVNEIRENKNWLAFEKLDEVQIQQFENKNITYP